jgi:hypothetical protein
MSNIFKLAENILNTLDQSTQSSIQTALNKTNPNTSNEKRYDRNLSTSAKFSNLAGSQSTANISRKNSSDKLEYKNNSARNSSSNLKSSSFLHAKKDSQSSKDDEFINFLNEKSLDSDDRLVQNSKSSLHAKTDASSDLEDDVKFIVGGDRSSKQSENEEEKEVSSDLKDANIEKPNLHAISNDDDEKKLLKNEIISLNDEIKSYNKRFKTLQGEFNRAKKKIEHYQSQISESDKIIRELRSREEDMSESIKSKDSQLGVLRIRFIEIENDLKAKKPKNKNWMFLEMNPKGNRIFEFL